MSQSWKAIVEQIQKLQLLKAADAEQLITVGSATESPAKSLTRLVKSNKLTKYQARQLLDGRANRLRMGNYVILGPLGEGAMGRVLKARHVQMNRIVAIKTLNKETAARHVTNKRFENEIRFVSQLSHPNIVQAFDAGIHNGVPYLVNEYIEGIDLQQLVSRSGPLMLSTALRYMTQAASAIAYAHSNKIIHRDIKPANLMINREGQIKLLDLGLARLNLPRETEMVDASLTDEHVIVGSCAFMAPELAKSPKAFGPSTDIYSLGCTLFFLLNGRIPYTGKTYMETFLAHAQSPIPRLCEAESPTAAQLNQLFQKLVAKTPQNRLQNMAEVAAEFKKLSEFHQEHESTNVSSASVSIPTMGSSTDSQWTLTDLEPSGPWYTKKETMIGSAIIAAGCIFAGVMYYTRPITQPQQQLGPNVFTTNEIPASGTAPATGSSTDPSQKSRVPQGQATKVFKVDGE